MSFLGKLFGKTKTSSGSKDNNSSAPRRPKSQSRNLPEVTLEERACDRFSPFTGILYDSQAERDSDPVHQARYEQYVLDHSYPSEGGNW